MKPLSLLPPDHLYFESYLEMAAIRRQVVEYLGIDTSVPQKIFVEKVLYKDGEVWIQTSNGPLLNKKAMAGIYVPEDPQDLEAISCLCH